MRIDVRIDFPARLYNHPHKLDPSEKAQRKAERARRWQQANRARLAAWARANRAKKRAAVTA